MPLVAHHQLPALQRLREEGEEVIDLSRAKQQDIRELHVGFLNLMPDAAFEATERQFLRLVGSCNRIVQFYVHPFTLDGIDRGETIGAHIQTHYQSFEEVSQDGLDALIVTGANVPDARFENLSFWPSLKKVFDFAQENVTSTLCACLATHAALAHFHGLSRLRMPRKRWGVFSHRPTEQPHPLVRGVNTRFDVPHSRFNNISAEAMRGCGVHPLASSDLAGVHLAVSPDLLRFVYFQGHPEYDRASLLKEYKREVRAFLTETRSDYPPLPERYFSQEGRLIAQDFEALVARSKTPELMEQFPEIELLKTVDNTWGDSARQVFNNWLGAVYKYTGYGRHDALAPGVDPQDPLSLQRP